MKKIHLFKEPDLMAKYDAFPYQKEAFEAVKDLEYAAIFHEQGLGKTKIAIDLLLYWLEKTDIDTVLIVTKKQLVANWIREFKDHTSLKPQKVDTNKISNYYVFCGPSRAVITNFEMLISEKEQFTLFLKTRNVAIIIDSRHVLPLFLSHSPLAFSPTMRYDDISKIFQERTEFYEQKSCRYRPRPSGRPRLPDAGPSGNRRRDRRHRL